MKIRFFLLWMLMWCGGSRAAAIRFENISVDDGLSQLSVLAIYEDRLGRMWFGTEEGINIYDGNTVTAFKDFGMAGKRIGTKIEYIVGDGENHIYFTAGTSLMRYDLQFQRFDCLDENAVHALRYHRKRLYYGKQNALYVFDPVGATHQKVCGFPAGSYLRSIFFDADGSAWVGTNKGLYVGHPKKGMRCILPKENIADIYKDSRKHIWVSTRDNGCFVFDVDHRQTHLTSGNHDTWISNYSLPQVEISHSRRIASDIVRGIVEDQEGNIWIGTFLGLNKYDPTTGTFTLYTHSNNSTSLSHSSVFPVFKDSRGAIWVGTYYGGVSYFYPQKDFITYYSVDATRGDCLSYTFTGHMVEDREGNVWICTEGGGLNLLDRRSRKFSYYVKTAAPTSIAHNNLKNIVYDGHRHRLYIGTHTGGLSFFDIATKRSHNLYATHPDYAERYGNKIFDVGLLRDTLVFTTKKGLWKMHVDDDKVYPLFAGSNDYGNTIFHIDRQRHIWIVSKDGLYRISLDNERRQRMYKYFEHGLGAHAISDIDEDVEGHLWLATIGGGVFCYDEKADSFVCYNKHNSNLASNFCYEVQPCGRELIVSTDRGICFLNPEKQQSRNMELGAGFPLKGINRGNGILVCKDGEIFIGGTNGMISFFKDVLTKEETHAAPFFSRLVVNEQEVAPGDNTGILAKALYETSRLNLKHHQNNITLSFSTCYYTGTYRHPVYEYRLEGYDNHWNRLAGTTIGYTKIPPGNYRLVIREVGSPQPTETGLDITISPPLYKTPWAYLLYILLIGAAVFILYRIKRTQLLLQNSLELEKRDKKNIEELNKAKLQFFANVSHEFRTPLTLIIARLDAILHDTGVKPSVHKSVETVYGHVNHLLTLFNELLDFRKLENGRLRLHVTENDMVPFLRDVFDRYARYAGEHDKECTFSVGSPAIYCWFDKKQMDKVVSNLLSNAFKYTPKTGGKIELRADETSESVIIRVIDNGIGIDRDETEKIFDRFYQVKDAPTSLSQPGTGIGLSLTQQLVSLHHGRIRVESAPGYGSIFIVELPKGNAHFSQEELSVDFESMQNIAETVRAEVSTAEPLPTDASAETFLSPYTILIVEDNEELLAGLQSLFARNCHVLTARDGTEGLDLTRRHLPDLVLSDVMMPGMDGTEMCRRIKADVAVCHIPVALLTAMEAPEQAITGYRCGADAYIAKPFHPQLLMAQCNSLVYSRRLLHARFSNEQKAQSSLLATNTLDRKFLADCDTYISRHLDTGNVSVDGMAGALGMGRTVFYNKMKALTGITPHDYIRTYKLKCAATWLRGDDSLSVADVAYRLGFASPKYFSQCFKLRFGVSPSEYRERTAETP